jgi:hypothetical protein
MRRSSLTLEEIADMALISTEELLEIAKREPKIASLIAGAPKGTPSSGIPPDPSMYGTVNRYLNSDTDFDSDSDFDVERDRDFDDF